MNPEELHRIGTEHILAGRPEYEPVPADGASRWPLSIVLPPPRGLSEQLDELTRLAARHAGRHQWLNGQWGAAHVTVRAMERRRRIPRDDPFLGRCARALDTAAGRHHPLVLDLTGVCLTPGGVLALLTPCGEEPDEFRTRTLGALLGADAWREGTPSTRDLWYASLIHFRGPVEDPAGLVAWADRHRELPPRRARFTSVALVTFTSTESAMMPAYRHSAMFGGRPLGRQEP